MPPDPVERGGWRAATQVSTSTPDAHDHRDHRGALASGRRDFQLRWTDVDLLEPSSRCEHRRKSSQTRYLALNADVLAALRTWQAATMSKTREHLFAGRVDGEPLVDIKTAWLPIVKAAKLPNFTFHDLRHTFASRLVMNGVNLYTVQRLLGHADPKMTQRYAHLSPEHDLAAVATLTAVR